MTPDATAVPSGVVVPEHAVTHRETPDGVMAPHIVLVVGGGIAAYKVVEVVRRLRESGARVQVLPSAHALEFVGAATWEAISGEPIRTDMWSNIHEVPHVRIGQQADLVLVAPATADLMARIVHGRSDDLIGAAILTARCPVILAPAMHTEMWQNAATVSNVATLRQRGMVVLEPAAGRLTGSDSGPGRLPEPEDIVATAQRVLARGVTGLAPDLHARHVLISAGGTREPIDPVRWVGNRSSGRMGYALAGAAAARGAQVTLVSANVDLPVPAGVVVIRVESAEQMAAAMLGRAATSDVIVMAAAVADHRPADVSTEKLSKDAAEQQRTLHLVRTPDILATLVEARALDASRAHQIIVGFAAETASDPDDLRQRGCDKLARKGADLLVVNDVSEGRVFGQAETEVLVLHRSGASVEVAGEFAGTKDTVADALWDQIRPLLAH